MACVWSNCPSIDELQRAENLLAVRELGRSIAHRRFLIPDASATASPPLDQ
jgi:hypothetical protein